MDIASIASQAWETASSAAFNFDLAAAVQNKWARAAGMAVIVWATIWIIALVYSGYARDSDLGPVGIRPHTNKKLGENKIVFDQSIFPFQMDGVEATCTFFYSYEDRMGKTKRIPLGPPETLQLHIRSSTIPRDANTHYGFEGPNEVEPSLVYVPAFDRADVPESIPATAATLGEHVAAHDLIEKWTEDDEAPVISVGATRWELLTDERATFIRDRARQLNDVRNGSGLRKLFKQRLEDERPNVFGNYYVRMQFSKDPRFVLFKHPNRELKMTAWLTVLTSFFSVAMDLWPVDHGTNRSRTTPSIERPVRATTTSLPSQPPNAP